MAYDCGTPSDGDVTERDRDYACLLLEERNNWREAAKAFYALIPGAKHDDPAKLVKAMALYEKAVKGDRL